MLIYISQNNNVVFFKLPAESILDPGDKIKFELTDIDGDICLTLSKESTFSYLLEELQEESKKYDLNKEELDQMVEETREKLVKDLYHKV